MNKIYLVAGLFVVGGIYLLISAAGDMSTYSTFNDAIRSGEKSKVVGTLAKDKEIYYNPTENPNYFSFHVQDSKGEIRKVILNRPKPQDFELSEQIVVTGKMRDNEFYASEILLKCPSKYKDEEIQLKAEN